MLVGSVGAAALAASLLAPPAQAHTGYSVPTESSSMDATVTATDGTTIQVRVIKPSSGGPFPTVVMKGGTGATRCANFDYMTRGELASFGYAVIGMQGRGMPGKAEAGTCVGGNQAADINDAINDSGSDWYGPKDVQDVKDVITWATAQSYVDDDAIGFAGHSHDAGLAYLLASQDTRVKAIVVNSGLSLGLKGNNVAAVSNKPQAAHAVQPMGFTPWAQGVGLGYDPAVVDNMTRWNRAAFTVNTPATAVRTWHEDRTVVDDDAAVDKAGDLSGPAVFVGHGWFDMAISAENAIQAYNKLPTGKKYLYVGTCHGHGNPCLTNNRAWLLAKVHAFLDKYLRGTAGSLGGPIFYAVPPADEMRSMKHGSGPTDGWTVTESTSATWPPAVTSTSVYLRANNVLGAAPTTNEAADVITSPNQTAILSDYCVGLVKAMSSNPTWEIQNPSGEYVQYTSDAFAGNIKVLGLDADIYASSTTDRLQLYVEVTELDPSQTDPAKAEIRLSDASQVVVVPTSYGQTAGTKVRFQFKPVSKAWTFKAGNKLRIRVHSNFKQTRAVEPVPASYSIHHTTTEPSRIVLHWTP